MWTFQWFTPHFLWNSCQSHNSWWKLLRNDPPNQLEKFILWLHWELGPAITTVEQKDFVPDGSSQIEFLKMSYGDLRYFFHWQASTGQLWVIIVITCWSHISVRTTMLHPNKDKNDFSQLRNYSNRANRVQLPCVIHPLLAGALFSQHPRLPAVYQGRWSLWQVLPAIPSMGNLLKMSKRKCFNISNFNNRSSSSLYVWPLSGPDGGWSFLHSSAYRPHRLPGEHILYDVCL